jgi:hypothetical protein
VADITPHVSPELVLVAPPDLAAAARHALPDRPWEAFLPSLPDDSETSFQTARPGREGILTPGPDAPAPESPAPLRRSRRGGALLRPVIVVAVLLTSLTALSSIPARDAPSLPATGRAGSQSSASTKQAPSEGPSAYLFGADGRIVISGDRRKVTLLDGPAPCGRRLALYDVAIGPKGRFGVETRIGVGAAAAFVKLAGRLVSPDRITGTLSVRTRSCDSPPVGFSARLS